MTNLHFVCLRMPREKREKLELEEDMENQKHLDRENKIYERAIAKYKGLLVIIVCDNSNMRQIWMNELKSYNPSLSSSERWIISNARYQIEEISAKNKSVGCMIIESSTLRSKTFLNAINKNVPVLLIVDQIEEIDNQNFKIDELSFIENRLGLINTSYDSIEESFKSYFNGLCFEMNIKELM